MTKVTVEQRNGKWVVVPKAKKGAILDKERFIAVKVNKHFLVTDYEQEADDYLRETGGTIYRLTYYIHDGSDGPEQLPMSNKWKEVKS